MITGRRRRSPVLVGVGAAVLSAPVLFWRIDRPTVWTDEAATGNAVRRSWGGLAHLLLGRDAPLVPYYVLAKIWYAVLGAAGDPWTVCRWLSAVLACGCVGVLARWLTAAAGPLTGVTAAAVVLALPGFDRYAQEARPYSAMMLVATWSWFEWHRLTTGHRTDGRRYAASVVLLSLTNPFALAQAAAQAATGVCTGRRAALRPLALGLLVGAPWTVWAAVTGRGPTAAHRHLTWRQVRLSAGQAVSGPPPSSTSVSTLLVLGACLVLVVLLARRVGGLAVPAVVWALAAPVLLTAAGAVLPIALVPRYWLSSLPGMAAVVALAVAGLGRCVERRAPGRVIAGAAAVLIVLALATLGAGSQRSMRAVDGHGEDARGAVAAVSRRGEVAPVLFATGGDALVIGELAPRLQPRFVGWSRAVRSRNVSQTAWAPARTRSALARTARVLLVVRTSTALRGRPAPAALRRVVAAALHRLQGRGVTARERGVVHAGGAWLVLDCALMAPSG